MDARPEDDPGADDVGAAPRGTPGPPDPAEQVPPAPADPVPDPSDDEVWASLVARLADVGVEPPETGRRVVRPTPPPEPAPVPPAEPAAPELVGRDWDGTSQYDAAEAEADELEHFVPGDPGPVLGGDPLLTLAWSGAVGVPVFLLLVVVLWQDAPALLVRAALGVFVVALAVLVWRMPSRRDRSDGDDGAVV